MRPRGPRTKLRLWTLYARGILREFRWTLLAVAALLGAGTAITMATRFGGVYPSFRDAFAGTFTLLSGNPLLGPPPTNLTAALYVLYPVLGLLVGAESLVRLSLLLFSKRHGEKEWSRIMASTYRNHVVLCGMGHLGFRVLERLLELDCDVVVIENDASNAFQEEARVRGVPLLLADAKSDATLTQAGVKDARAIIIATNDVMANLEISIDARRLNPDIRVIMRMFDAGVAKKLGDALELDVAFSSSALAAPTVAAAIFDAKVLSTFTWNGRAQMVAELVLEPGAELTGLRIAALEAAHAATVLSLRKSGTPAASAAPSEANPSTARPPAQAELGVGDALVVHVGADRLAALARAARGSARSGKLGAAS